MLSSTPVIGKKDPWAQEEGMHHARSIKGERQQVKIGVNELRAPWLTQLGYPASRDARRELLGTQVGRTAQYLAHLASQRLGGKRLLQECPT